MALVNTWNLRSVAESASKPCMICHKSSSAVLITPDNKDFFYTCRTHLTDKQFCNPKGDSAEEAAQKRKEALEREIELVKKEYEERIKRRKERAEARKKVKSDEKDKKKDEKEDKEAEKESKEDEKAKDEKVEELTKKVDQAADVEGPRVFELTKTFFQMRFDRLRNAEIARQNRERLKDPAYFPSVPKHDV